MLRDEDGSEQTGARNVLGDALAPCSLAPVTGFFRDGRCRTCAEDRGSHTVCAVVTDTFLSFSRSRGNDLSAPLPQAGDQWCLCAPRWQEALEAGVAPKVVLAATNEGALAHCALADLKANATDKH